MATRKESEESATVGRGWHGNPEGHAAAGRKGGQTVSQNKDHMSTIGRRGGEAVSQDRRHMSEIGRKGGQARSTDPSPPAQGDGSTKRKPAAA